MHGSVTAVRAAALGALLAVGVAAGCSDASGGAGMGDGGSSPPFAVTATLSGSSTASGPDFRSNDVLVTYVGDFGFSLTAVDRERTILLSAQDTDGDTLAPRRYTVGPNDGTGVVVGASVVVSVGGEDAVFNALPGEGNVLIVTYGPDRALGTFTFAARTPGDGSEITVEGRFNVVPD